MLQTTLFLVFPVLNGQVRRKVAKIGNTEIFNTGYGFLKISPYIDIHC